MTKLLLALGGGLLLAIALVGYQNRHRFRYRPGTLDLATYQQLARRPGFAADELLVTPGVALRGLVRRPARATSPWLLFFPGNGSDVLAGAQALLLRLAGDDDLGLAVWAPRGFDGSGGVPTERDLMADGRQMWAHLHADFGVAPEQLHLVSFSLGTAPLLQLAAELEARGTPPASLVLLSPYDRLRVTPDVWWAPWMFADAYDALVHASSSKVSSLLVHGAADDAVPVDAARTLARAMGARAELLELPGRGHADWLEDADVMARVRAFVASRSSR